MLAAKRNEIDEAFAAADLPNALQWPGRVTAGRWAIRYTVAANYPDKVDPERLRELNRAAAEMKRVFDPHLDELDPQFENDSLEPLSEDVED